MKRIILILLAALSIGVLPLAAQNDLEIRRVGLDSLVRFLRKEFQQDIYFIKDDEEQSTFSVSAPRERFLEAALDRLRESGYVVSTYGGSTFYRM